jgi:RNA polymerase sigma-70 factor (ECF subfamily)
MRRELVLEAQRGDLDAYSALTALTTHRLYAVAKLILRDQDRAADAVQDALLQGWVDIRSLRDPDRFDAWLRRVLVRTCYAAAKRHRRHSVVELHVTLNSEPSAPDDQQAVAVRDQLDRAFARLSVEHRTVIVLVHYLGLSLAETAETVGVPLGTIQSRLSRAVQALRGVIEADDRAPSRAVEGVR